MACVVIVGVMGLYWVAHGPDAPAPASNAASADTGVGASLMSGSDNPDDLEAGAQDEPELIELRKQEATGGGGKTPKQKPPPAATPARR